MRKEQTGQSHEDAGNQIQNVGTSTGKMTFVNKTKFRNGMKEGEEEKTVRNEKLPLNTMCLETELSQSII